jgi:glyoxylase-like metal-dependent hydrolase (beta-lactamase superfamily II)
MSIRAAASLAAIALAASTAVAQTPGAPSPAAPTAPTPPATAAAPPPYATSKVADNVYVFRYGDHQAMFVVTPGGVIATDPIAYQRPQAAQTYVDEIRKVTQAPIRYLVYSHHHYDHIAGGKPFKDAGALVVAHRNARARLEALKYPDQGKCFGEAMKTFKLPKYEAWSGYAGFLPGNVERFCEYWARGI